MLLHFSLRRDIDLKKKGEEHRYKRRSIEQNTVEQKIFHFWNERWREERKKSVKKSEKKENEKMNENMWK